MFILYKKIFLLAAVFFVAQSFLSYSYAEEIRTLDLLTVTENSGVFEVSIPATITSSSIKAFDAENNSVTLNSFENGVAAFAASPVMVIYEYSDGSNNYTAVLKTDDAKLLAACSNGIFVGASDVDVTGTTDDVISWRGIPFAKQPTGELRWKAPQSPEKSYGFQDAKEFGHSSLQYYLDSYENSLTTQDEDSLLLNIWTRDESMSTSNKKKAVFVYIYGGAFTNGGTSYHFNNPLFGSIWGGHRFVRDNEDIIFVSIAYRLGLLGFIDFSEVPGNENFPDAPNLGVLDAGQAIKWLHENISMFGGDPDNITVCGLSSGSAITSILLTMPDVNKYIRRGIMQSGSLSMTSPKSYGQRLASKLLEASGKTDMDGLMSLTSQDIKELQLTLSHDLAFPGRGTTIISDDPYEYFSNASSIDILIGTTADEARYLMFVLGSVDQYADFLLPTAYNFLSHDFYKKDKENAEKFLQNYKELHSDEEYVDTWAKTELFNDVAFRTPAINMADIHARNKKSNIKTYMYYWAAPAKMDANLGFDSDMPIGAAHSSDGSYVTGYPFIFNGAINTESGFEFVFPDLAKQTQNMFVTFAKTGTPEIISSDVTWKEYTPEKGETLFVNTSGDIMGTYEFKNASGAKAASLTPYAYLSDTNQEAAAKAQELYSQYQISKEFVKYFFSGCELFNSNFAYIAQKISEPGPVEPAEESDPTDPADDSSKESDTEKTAETALSSSGGGCDAGINSSLLLIAVLGLIMKNKRK